MRFLRHGRKMLPILLPFLPYFLSSSAFGFGEQFFGISLSEYETSQDAKFHFCYTKYVHSVYDCKLSIVVALIGENCLTKSQALRRIIESNFIE